jgi:hypothetical protein
VLLWLFKVYGDKGSNITVLRCSFVNNTFDSEGAAIKVSIQSRLG